MYGIIIPVLIAGILFAVAWRPWRRYSQLKHAETIGPLAIGISYLVGHIGIAGFPSFPPVEAVQWLIYFAAIIIVLGMIESLRKGRKFFPWGIRLHLAFGLPWMLLRSMFQHHWGTIEGMVWVLGTGLLILLFWKTLDALAEGFTGYPAPLLFLIIATGLSIALVISGSALLGHLSGLLAAAMGIAFFIALFVPSFSLAHGATSFYAVVLGGLLINGYFYSELSMLSILPLIAAPMVPWVGKLSIFKKRGILWINAVASVSIAILIGIAVLLAIQASPPLNYGY